MRWRERNKAMKFNPDYPIDKETLKAQEEATRKLQLIYREVDNQKKLGGNGLHEHLCTFKMLSNDKSLQQAECRKWLAAHPIEYPEGDFWEPCDFCAMMNYVAQDDEGKIMYVSRTFPKDLLEWEKNKHDNT